VRRRKLNALQGHINEDGLLMRDELRPGERIRLTPRVRVRGYCPGDRGIVLSGYQATEAGWRSYYVRMEGQSLGAWTLFAAEEIERDGEQPAQPPPTKRPIEMAKRRAAGKRLKTRYVEIP
jgi:hypothetical protein